MEASNRPTNENRFSILGLQWVITASLKFRNKQMKPPNSPYKTKQNKTKQNKTKQNKTKQNKIKPNNTKQERNKNLQKPKTVQEM